MKDLINSVKYYIHRDGLKTRCRTREYVHKRFFFFNLLREHGVTYQRIGELFKVNHATVMHGIKRYKELTEINDQLLLIDISEYKGKKKLEAGVLSLKKDINKATSTRDLSAIKKKVEKKWYKELEN